MTHTVTMLGETFHGKVPPLALLGGGAYDSLAALGGRGAAEDRLKRLSEAVATESPLRTTERDTLRVRPEGGAVRCGFRFGVGLPVRFVEEVYRSGRAGLWTSSRVLVRAASADALYGT